MKQIRGLIRSIEETKKRIKQLGGLFKSNYSFTDIIFLPTSKKINFNKEFIRLRTYKISKWPTKNFLLVHKKTWWKKGGKVSRYLIKKGFNTRREANAFINKKYGAKIKKGYEFSRIGWEYKLGKTNLYVENIKGFKPTIEIETASEKDMENLFKQLKITKKILDSVPELIRKSKK